MYATLAHVTNREEIYQAILLELDNIPAKEYDYGTFEFNEKNIYRAYPLKAHKAIILTLKGDKNIYELFYEEFVWNKIKEVLDGRRTQENNSGT